MNGLKRGLTCLMLLWGSFVMGQDNIIDEIVAVVGDEVILRSDIENEYQRQVREGTQRDGDLKCQILESLLLQKLLIAQAAFDSVYVDDERVVSVVEQRLSQFISQIGSAEKVENYFNKSMAEIKEELTIAVENGMLTEMMQAEITKDVRVTPSEIRNFYKSLPQDSLPMVDAQYEIQRMYLKPRIEPAQVEAVKSQLREYRDKVNEGSDFSTLAILYSKGPSGIKGGEIGFLGKGELESAYAEVAFSLTKEGEMGKVVETSYGFHLIQLIERKGNRVNTRHILLRPESTPEAKRLVRDELDSLMNLVREERMSFSECIYRFSHDEDTRNADGVLSNPRTGSSKFDLPTLSEISPAMAITLEKMKVNEISDPFLMKTEKDSEVYAVLKLKSKIPSHRLNIKDDYQMIKHLLINKKKEEVMLEWVKKKRTENYIKLDSKWINCDFDFEGWGS